MSYIKLPLAILQMVMYVFQADALTTWRGGGGREVGREWGVQEGGRGHRYADGRFMWLYGQGHHNIVTILQLK